MSQENKVSISFTQEEIAKVKKAIQDIASVLAGKAQSLTPKERQTFGRVKYEKEVWIDKVKTHMDANPSKIPPYVDKAEFDKDYTAHKQLNELVTLLQQQLDQMQDTNLLLGYDLDTSAGVFYRAVKFASENNDPGAISIYTDLRQQYPSTRKKKPVEEGGNTPS